MRARLLVLLPFRSHSGEQYTCLLFTGANSPSHITQTFFCVSLCNISASSAGSFGNTQFRKYAQILLSCGFIIAHSRSRLTQKSIFLLPPSSGKWLAHSARTSRLISFFCFLVNLIASSTPQFFIFPLYWKGYPLPGVPRNVRD